MANASWIDAEALEPDDDEDNEMWHVVLSEGEVKTVTLEQLDDFFRLDVIDVNTKVWGPDMDGWTSLGEALGIEADDDDGSEEISVVTDDFNPHERPTVKQSLPPPPFAPQGRGGLPRLVAVPEPDSRPRSYSPPPKLTPYAAVAIEDYRGDVETVAKAYVPPPRLQPTYPPVNSPKSTQTFGVPPKAVSPYGAPSAGIPRAPALPSASVFPPPAHPSAYPPVASAYPPVASAYPPVAHAAPRSAYPAAMEQPGASLRPASMDIPTSSARRDSIRAFASDPDIYMPKPSRFGAWLMAAAVLAGAVVTLYRNDILRDLAHRAGQDAAYARLETALGGPAFGTLRSVEHSRDGAEVTTASLAATSLLPRAEEPRAEAPKAEEPKAEATAEAAKVESPKAEAKPPAAAKAVAIDALPPETAKPVAAVRETPKPVAASTPLPAPKKAKPVEVDEPLPKAKMKATVAALSSPTKKEEPAPKPAPAAKKAKVEADEALPGLPPSLDEAIRDRATRPSKKTKGKAQSYDTPSSTPAAKKKKGGSEYDPLNSDL